MFKQHKILKLYFFILCNVAYFTGYAQGKIKISGRFIEVLSNKDSILFLSESTENYYNIKNIKVPVVRNSFNLMGNFIYPHMYRVRLLRETDKIPYRNGFLFLDNSTNSIVIDSIGSKSYSDGRTGIEFRDVFTPFFIDTNQNYSIDRYVINKGEEFDEKLLMYTSKYPDSYVALWFLITRFNNDGYSDLQNSILLSFSKTMKSSKLWQILNDEFKNLKIKKGLPFPNLALQNKDLQQENVKIPKSKYTFIDYWFSRCAPCLAQLPYLQQIYNSYNTKGFNVIGIATDKTEHVKDYWQKRIVDRNILWKNYLDENGKEALSEKIYSYPTNFLLDKDGLVIQKNISLDDLAKLLATELNKDEIKFYDPIRF